MVQLDSAGVMEVRYDLPIMRYSLAGIALSCAAAGLGAQGPCLDQVYTPRSNNGLEITANQSVTQTFTVGRSGVLARIDLVDIGHHRGVSTTPLDFALVTVDPNGVPTTTVLASVMLQPSAVPISRGEVGIDLQSFNIVVTQGQMLGIWLRGQSSSPGPTYGWWGEAPGNYSGGDIFIRGTSRLSWDLSFRTYLQQPASWQNYGSGHPGSSGVPALTASANPVLGITIAAMVGSSAPASTQGALLIGLSQASVPTTLGGTLLVQIAQDLTITVPPSGLNVPIPIPFDPNLCGVSVYFQTVLLDGGASAGVSFSPGLQLTFGL